MVLSAKDKQIIALLDREARLPVSELARRLRLSKDGVNYRLKKLQESGTISRFFIDIDVAKLGLILNKVTFQFQNVDEEKQQEIFSFLKDHPKVGWVVFGSGRWDAIIVAYVRDLHEYRDLVSDINKAYGKHILAKAFAAHQDYFVCSRKWLSEDDEPTVSHIGGKVSPVEVDGTDIKILKSLAADARRPIIEIAQECGVSSTLVIQRIRKLEKNKVILNYRIGLDLQKVGKEFCKSFVYLQNASKEQEERIVNHCLRHPNVTAVTRSIGPWDLELEMEVEDFDEFYKVMNRIKNEFKQTVRNYEAVVINREYGIDYSTIL